MGARTGLLIAGLLVAAVTAEAKEFRYSGGPVPPDDTTLSVASAELVPVVSTRGPKVPYTNLQLVNLVADAAFDHALQSAPLESGGHVFVAPAESHPLNFVAEHAILRHLARRGVTATVRRTIIPDDSLAVFAGRGGDPVLEYQLATARVTYLRLVGWLPFSGRVKIERQGMVEGAMTMRDPNTSVVLWLNDASHNLVDRFSRDKLSFVEDERFSDLTNEPPKRNAGKVLEPIVVVAIVGGLIALFFQNRP